MIRAFALAALALAVMALPAQAEENGRYQIVSVPLEIEGQGTTTLLVDTLTGRSWYASIDENGRPRWRGFQFYTESTEKLEPPPLEGTGDTSVGEADAQALQSN